MQGVIQEMGQSKAGNPKVKINGTWYSIKSAFGLGVGSVLDFEAQPFTISGKTYQGIEKFAVVSVQTPVTSQVSQAAPAVWPASRPSVPLNQPPPLPSTQALTEPELRFISNCVGSAIMAKTAIDPIDLIAWAKGAQAALRSLTDAGF